MIKTFYGLGTLDSGGAFFCRHADRLFFRAVSGAGRVRKFQKTIRHFLFYRHDGSESHVHRASDRNDRHICL